MKKNAFFVIFFVFLVYFYGEKLYKNLFSKIEGNENTIMGLPVDKIKQYIESLSWKNI